VVENVNRATQIDCPKDEDGNPIGSFQYQGNVANRALELLAKTLGMLIEKSEVTRKRDYADLSNLQLLQLLAKEARELELLEQGKVIDTEALWTDFRLFKAWCEAKGVSSLPATPETVAAFLAAETADGTKPSTLARRIAAICYAHKLAQLDTLTDSEAVIRNI
jgi:hypothetical protein